MDHHIVVWKEVGQKPTYFSRFDSLELAAEFRDEKLEDVFIELAIVQSMNEDTYREFLQEHGLWKEQETN